MLQTIREKTSGWVATLILGLIILTFGLFGVNNYFKGGSETYAARITIKPGWFGTGIGARYKEITRDDFRQQLQLERGQEQRAKGAAFDPAAFDSIAKKREVLDHVIQREILKAAAARDGIVVSGQQVFDRIAAEPLFQVNGRFDKARYVEVLANQNPPLLPVQYEADKRDEMLLTALPDAIAAAGLASDADIDEWIRLSDQKRDLRFLVLPAPADAAAPTDAELDAWYKAHLANYRTPELVALDYLELDADTLPVPTTVDEKTLRDRYDQQKNRFVEPEQRLASDILVAAAADAPPAVDKAAQAKATAIAAQARAPGADFAAIARAQSDDEGSKNLGGDLGWLARNVIPEKDFAAALFALQPGAVSAPVRTKEGWHVVQLREIRAGRQIPFESVRAELEKNELKDAGEKAYNDLSGKLVDLTLKDPSSLAPAARELGLKVQRTPLFGRAGGPGIAADPKVLREAFSSSVLEDGNTSDAIELTKTEQAKGERVVVVRVAQHLPVRTLAFAQVRDRVLADLTSDRRGKAAKAAADAMLARATKGETLDALAIASGGTVQAQPGTNRSVTVPSADLVTTAFRLARPVAGKPPAIALASVGAGRYALVEVDKVVDGNPAAMEPAMRATMRTQYAQRLRGGLEQRAYLDALRKSFPVEVAEDRL